MIEFGWKMVAVFCISIGFAIFNAAEPIASLSLPKFAGLWVAGAFIYGGLSAFMKAIDARAANQQAAPALASSG